MFVRKKPNPSGSVSVQVVDKSSGYRVLKTIGTARDPQDVQRLVPVVTLALTVAGVAFSGFAELAAGGRSFTDAGGWSPAAQLFLGLPFWAWSLTMALMFWLFGMSLWWPDPLVGTASKQASPHKPEADTRIERPGSISISCRT